MQELNRRSFLASSGLAALGTTAHVRKISARESAGAGLYTSIYPSMPRIECHAHIGSDSADIERFNTLRVLMAEQGVADMALWINLGGSKNPVDNPDAVEQAGRGRILSCISDYRPHTGFDIPPATLKGCLDKGFVGYKIWAGPPGRALKDGQKGYPYIDDTAHIPTFTAMEDIGMVAASIHIADPNGPFHDRTPWLPDPVEFWKQMMAYRNIVERHPKLIFVTAHAMWSICQDAQIDYLRYMLAMHDNLNVDLAATFQYYSLVDRDNLRDFMIEYSDRILFGTDISRWDDDEKNVSYLPRYGNCFRILETDETVSGGFFGGPDIKGLDLPAETLEKIYCRNAMRLYPRVEERMKALGYSI